MRVPQRRCSESFFSPSLDLSREEGDASVALLLRLRCLFFSLSNYGQFSNARNASSACLVLVTLIEGQEIDLTAQKATPRPEKGNKRTERDENKWKNAKEKKRFASTQMTSEPIEPREKNKKQKQTHSFLVLFSCFPSTAPLSASRRTRRESFRDSTKGKKRRREASSFVELGN